MKIEKSLISAKLAKIKSAIPPKPVIECMKGVLVKDGTLTATNLEIAITTDIGVDTDETFILPDKAIEMIMNLPQGEVEITCTAEHAITIKTGGIKNKFQSFDPAAFPAIENTVDGDALSVTLNGDDLQASMGAITYAISDSEAKPIQTGMLLECDGENLNLVACDGFRLAWATLPYTNELKMVVPKQSIQKLLQLGVKGDVHISYNRKSAVFVFDNYVFFTRLLEGAFMEYKKMFVSTPISVVVDRKALIDSINRASILSTESKKPQVCLDIDKVIRLSTNSAYGDYSEEISMEQPAEAAIQIGFNGRLLLDTLKTYSVDKLSIGMTEALKPAIIHEENIRTLVLPVRLKQ